MINLMKHLLDNKCVSSELSGNGLRTIHERHTCTHRVNELYKICEEIDLIK